jgi:hypothetical protein
MDEHTTPSVPDNPQLPAEQAADVIQFYNDVENKRSREHGWKDKVSLGQSAMHTTSPQHSIVPDGASMLTYSEMEAGMEHIENPPKSDKYWARVDEVVDKQNVPYEKAKRIVEAEGLK